MDQPPLRRPNSSSHPLCGGCLTLVDRRNSHLFQPLLYQVATGSLSPREIAAPLRSVLSAQKNTRVLLGTIVDSDPESKRVLLKDGGRYSLPSRSARLCRRQVELAWTVMPVLIVVALFLAAPCVIASVQDMPRPPGALGLVVTGQQ